MYYQITGFIDTFNLEDSKTSKQVFLSSAPDTIHSGKQPGLNLQIPTHLSREIEYCANSEVFLPSQDEFDINSTVTSCIQKRCISGTFCPLEIFQH